MAERPILFSAPMVRALLAGSKTQTRRIVKPAPVECGPIARPLISFNRGVPEYSFGPGDVTAKGDLRWWRCPYGVPGDTLWVREEFSGSYAYQGYPPREWLPGTPIWWWADGQPTDGDWCKPKPSIHMPRWASRITLKITDVRVERLNEISAEDAKAEGVEPPETEREDHDWSICPACGGTGLHGALGEHLGYMEVDCTDCDTHAKRYRHLWEQINGPGSWAANPWCWAVSFELANAQEGA